MKKMKSTFKKVLGYTGIVLVGFFALIVFFVPNISRAEEATLPPEPSVEPPVVVTEAPPVQEVLAPVEAPVEAPAEADTQVADTNQTEITNTVTTDANTGVNAANENDGNGNVATGDVNVAADIASTANSNLVNLGDGTTVILSNTNLGDLNGDYLVDPTTGDLFVVQNGEAKKCTPEACEDDLKTLIASGNLANVLNNIAINANTGQNTANGNDGNGTVATGNINILLNLLNLINSNIVITDSGLIGIMNVLGNWNGNLILPQNIVDLLTSQTGIVIATGGDINIQNENNASINNNVNVAANTGGNTAVGNDGNGSISTGNIITKLVLWSIANQNIVGGNIVFFLINVLGNWNGTNEIAELITQPNNTSGGCSECDTELNIQSTNNATLENNILVTANTGGNSTSENDGNGTITTGNINILMSILNILNSNIFANRLFIFVINILGDWNGSIIPEPQDPINQGNVVNIMSGGNISGGGAIFRRTFVMFANGTSLAASTEEPLVLGDKIVSTNTNDERIQFNETNLDKFMRSLQYVLVGLFLLLAALLVIRDSRTV